MKKIVMLITIFALISFFACAYAEQLVKVRYGQCAICATCGNTVSWRCANVKTAWVPKSKADKYSVKKVPIEGVCDFCRYQDPGRVASIFHSSIRGFFSYGGTTMSMDDCCSNIVIDITGELGQKGKKYPKKDFCYKILSLVKKNGGPNLWTYSEPIQPDPNNPNAKIFTISTQGEGYSGYKEIILKMKKYKDQWRIYAIE